MVSPKSIIERLKAYSLSIQVFLVVVVFAVMVIVSYLFVNTFERRHLTDGTRSTISYVQAIIESDIREIETLLNIITKIVGNMMQEEYTEAYMTQYLDETSKRLGTEFNISGFHDIYAYFDGYGFANIGRRTYAKDHATNDLEWYNAAFGTERAIAVTGPYVSYGGDTIGRDTIITYARRIVDRSGRHMGVIGLCVQFSKFTQHLGKLENILGSNAALYSHDMTVASPPFEELVGLRTGKAPGEMGTLMPYLLRDGEISAREAFNRAGEEVIVFFRIMNNNWILSLTVPKHQYYKNTRTLAVFLTALGAILATILSTIMISLTKAKRKSETLKMVAFQKVREADERTQMMLDAAPVGVTMWDINGKLLDCNMEAARVVGIYSKEEYFERFTELAPERQPNGKKTAALLAETLSKVFAKGNARVAWEHNTINGETIPFDMTAVRLKDDRSGGHIAVAYARDMREVNAAMAQINEANERIQVLLDATPLCVNFWTPDIRNTECNLEAVRLFELSSKQEYLNRFTELSPKYQLNGELSSESAVSYVKKAFKEGYSRFDWMHQKLDGELIPCEITLVRVKFQNEYRVAGYTRDLREFKRMVNNMHRAEIAEKGNRAKSRFLAAMSHEIRTPMNVILGVAEMQMQDDTLAPYQREALMQIYNASDLLLGIINDILDLSKIEADKMNIIPAKYELASLISDSASLNVMRSSNPTEFELDVSEDVPTSLIGDELRIKQILNNILSNAFKFTEKGTVKLTVFVKDSVSGWKSENDVTLYITVSDSGHGMSKEHANRLFTEYTRFNAESNRTVEGTGLGMNITYRLVNLMGGRISVESELGRGTTVNISIPQKRASAETIGRELAENLRKFRKNINGNRRRTLFRREYMPYGKVLIVDDVESNLYVAKGLMAPYGLAIDTASGGQAAIDKIKSGETYDVIFMDQMMPNMDGMEAVKHIRNFGYTLPIVALTANAVVGQANIFLENGFDDFISKPIDVRQLNALLNKLVRDKQPPEILANAQAENEKNIMQKQSNTFTSSKMASPELLAVFVQDANKALPIIESAAQNTMKLSANELRLFTTSVHGIKSALTNIGETRLAQMALSLEEAGKVDDRNKITARIHNFLKALRGVTAKAEVESKTKEYAKKDEAPEYLREQLAIIALACKNYDERTITQSLENLKKMSWTAETEQLLEKIAVCLLHSNFEEAAAEAMGNC